MALRRPSSVNDAFRQADDIGVWQSPAAVRGKLFVQPTNPQSMFDLIQMGGPVFTYPLTLLLFAILGLIALTAAKGDPKHRSLLLHIGVFSAVWGVLGQAIGLYQAMGVIEQVGGISPQMLAGGLKVSFVSTLFGLGNLVIALAGWTILGYRKGD